MTETLQNLLISRIQKTGPISLTEFMAEALHNKNFGYYTTRDPLGSLGDFTTAPEISQIFGELIGLWILHAHQQQELDGPLCLVELGPGRGTLMSDIILKNYWKSILWKRILFYDRCSKNYWEI